MSTHVLTIDNWRPVSTNRLIRAHWATRRRLLRFDADVIALHALAQSLPRAAGRRRVKTRVEAVGNLPDSDNCLKSLLDGLVKCRLLIDDAPRWCEAWPPEVVSGPRDRTIVTLEDL